MKPVLDTLGYVALTVMTLLPIINPLGTAILLLGIGAHLDDQERNRQVRRACLYMTAILLAFLLLGSIIMGVLGISIPGLRIAGGMVIAYIGFNMLFPDEPTATPQAIAEAQRRSDIAFTPLAMPSLSGPGAIATVISMSSTIQRDASGLGAVLEYAGVIVGILATAIVCYVVLRGAARLNRVLGPAGVVGVSRVMGFLLVCVAVQFVINGMADLMADPRFAGPR